MRIFKIISFALAGLLVLLMMAATVIEKLYGSEFVAQYIYGSSYFAVCWGLLALSSVIYLWQRKVQKQILTFLLHASFVVILAGALITHLFGLQGSVHLRQDSTEPVQTFTTTDGTEEAFPFQLYLSSFHLEYYPGTVAPMDFVSNLLVKDGDEELEGEVAMNHIYSYRNYRFYQSRYDSDGKGTTLSVSYDPYGIAVTYIGYGMLLASICLFFFGKQSQFRHLLRHPLLKTATVCLILCGVFATEAQAKKDDAPRTLPKKAAQAFGNLYVYYNDRICPVQTLAKDFTVKLYGKASYKGLTPEQVLTGWFFYYDYWKEEPCIKIGSKEVQQLLGIEGKYARLTDFGDINGYKLDKGMQEGSNVQDKRGLEEANEKFSLISMVATGAIWKLYPYVSVSDSTQEKSIVWYSLIDRPSYDMPVEQSIFIRSSMNYVAEQVARNDYQKVDTLLSKIRKYQIKEAGDYMPSELRFKAEKWYNSLNNSRPLAMVCLTIGILSFLIYCRSMISKKQVNRYLTMTLLSLMALLFVYLTLVLTLRGFASGHAPMSNGHETMQVMAACTALLTLFFHRKISISLSFGFLLCGLALLVSMMGEANPKITQLMPVLSSPLLSFHVMVIMIAYSLLAFIMLNGITAVILYYSRKEHASEELERLQLISRILLYPAVFCLAIGIFIGAVWANISWGRYWGWDPKEVWALITMLVYALALHPASLPWFRRPMFFHVFSIVAFLTVLITYFGVNFLLGGMHSYAG